MGIGLGLLSASVEAAPLSLKPDIARDEPVTAEVSDIGADASMESGKDGGSEPREVVVVTASRTARPRSESVVATQVIGPQQIAASGARTAAELLEEAPGLFLEGSAFGGGVRLQGLPPDYTLILVDGVRATGRIGGTLDLTRFPVEDIERIEIVRGAASALYGSDAIAGVVNIVTRKSLRRWELDGRASAGRYRTIDATASIGMSRKRWSSRWSVGHHESQGFDLEPGDAATTVGASNQYNLSTTTTYSPSEDMDLELTGGYLFRDRRAVDLGGGGAIFDRANRTETARAQVASTVALGDDADLKLWTSVGLFRDQFLMDQRGADALDELQDTWDLLIQVGGQWDQRWPRHRASMGVEGSREGLETARLAGGSASRLRGAVYVQDELTLATGRATGAGRFVLMPGARLDADSQFGAYATPRLAARYDPHRNLSLRASYGWGFKAPDFRELYLLFQNTSANYLVEGSTELEPEKSQSVRAGIELRPSRSVSGTLDGFYNRLRDRISTQLAAANDAGPRRFIYDNIDASRTAGIEAGLNLRLARGLLANFGYTFTDARDLGTRQPLSGQPRHRGTIGMTYSDTALGFSTLWRAALVGLTPVLQDTDGDGESEARQSAGYASVDIRIAQRLVMGLSGFLLAENLLNARAEFSPLTPRSFSGGIRFAR